MLVGSEEGLEVERGGQQSWVECDLASVARTLHGEHQCGLARSREAVRTQRSGKWKGPGA